MCLPISHYKCESRGLCLPMGMVGPTNHGGETLQVAIANCLELFSTRNERISIFFSESSFL